MLICLLQSPFGPTIHCAYLAAERLHAKCRKPDGSWASSELDLNQCLVNDDGRVGPAAPAAQPERFMEMCRQVMGASGGAELQGGSK